MAFQTLPLQDMLDDEQGVSYEYRVLSAQFGDGYAQIAPDGINNEIRKVTFTYRNLEISDFNRVMTFLRGLKGATPFKVKLHGETQQTLYRLDPASLTSTVTAKHRNDTSVVHRTIQFSAYTCYDIV